MKKGEFDLQSRNVGEVDKYIYIYQDEWSIRQWMMGLKKREKRGKEGF